MPGPKSIRPFLNRMLSSTFSSAGRASAVNGMLSPLLSSLPELLEGKTILNVGGGDGRVAKELRVKGADVWLLESDKTLVESAIQYGRVGRENTLCMRLENMPSKYSGAFDLGLVELPDLSSIRGYRNCRQFFEALARVCKPNGRIVIGTEKKELERFVRPYFDEVRIEETESDFNGFVVSCRGPRRVSTVSLTSSEYPGNTSKFENNLGVIELLKRTVGKNTDLGKIDLSGPQLPTESTWNDSKIRLARQAFFFALSGSRSAVNLDLSCRPLDSDDITALGSVIKSNFSLERLYLKNCGLKPDDIIVLVEALNSKSFNWGGVEYIDVSGNDLPPSYVQLLNTTLKNCSSRIDMTEDLVRIASRYKEERRRCEYLEAAFAKQTAQIAQQEEEDYNSLVFKFS